MFKKILKLIYPNTCGFCDKILENGFICDECQKLILPVGNTCDICGREIENISNRCLNCLHKKAYYSKLIYIYKYKDIIRKKIIAFKFNNKTYLCRCFAENIVRKLVKLEEKFDIIIPVPIHWKRLRKRGYNQSYLVAKEVSKKLKVNLENKVLMKKKNTAPQSSLKRKERKSNTSSAYSVQKKEKIIGKKILLIDDIFTTGATVNECSKELKYAGAKEIIVVTIAR